jgi:hypothetical protein
MAGGGGTSGKMAVICVFFSGAALFCVQEAGKKKDERKIVNVS